MATVNWDDESIQKPETSRRKIVNFKGIAGHTQRILLIDKAAVMVKQHYVKKAKKYVRCIADSNNGYCPACDEIGQPAMSFGANVIVYETEPDGTVVKDDRNLPKFQLALWIFGPDKFTYIRELRKEWGDLRNHDLIVQCTDAQFQKLTIMPAASALWLQNEDLKHEVVEDFKENAYDVEKIIGKALSPADIKIVLAGGTLKPDSNGSSKDDDVAPAQQKTASRPKEQPAAPKQSEPEPLAETPVVDFDSLLNDL